MRIGVAMSGGVDSAVAAALLKKQGHDIFGVTMLVIPADEKTDGRIPGIAEEITKKLEIPHFVFDLRELFAKSIISEFCTQYGMGRTPNPCVRCNRLIKFGALFEKVREIGAEAMATGHYARIEQHQSGGRYLLRKGTDHKRDQSYFLSDLNQEQLSRSLFPLGSLSKDMVWRLANEMALPVVENSESREICFITDDDYIRFLRQRSVPGTIPGAIKNKQGKTIGEHRGIINYTIGQRHGLGISSPEPLYVVSIDAADNSIIVGSRQDIFTALFVVSGLNWMVPPESTAPFDAWVRIRSLHSESRAELTQIDNGRVQVRFYQPQWAVTPGQAAVFYDRDVVLGGGMIERIVNENKV
jgi:tRNA-uridine 2-sulfurtransferase